MHKETSCPLIQWCRQSVFKCLRGENNMGGFMQNGWDHSLHVEALQTCFFFIIYDALAFFLLSDYHFFPKKKKKKY